MPGDDNDDDDDVSTTRNTAALTTIPTFTPTPNQPFTPTFVTVTTHIAHESLQKDEERVERNEINEQQYLANARMIQTAYNRGDGIMGLACEVDERFALAPLAGTKNYVLVKFKLDSGINPNARFEAKDGVVSVYSDAHNAMVPVAHY